MMTVKERLLIKRDYNRRYSVIEEEFDTELEELELELREECRIVTRVNTVGRYRIKALNLVDEHVKLSYEACRAAWKNQDGEDSTLIFSAFVFNCLGSIFSKLHQLNLTQVFRSVEGDTWPKALRRRELKWITKLGIETGEVNVAPIDTPKLALPVESEVAKAAKSNRRSSPAEKRHKAIYAIIQSTATGKAYCKTMDRDGIKPPAPWLADSWPGSYVAAYTAPKPSDRMKWRKKIQSEKYRHSKK